jgi:hypothetical protein
MKSPSSVAVGIAMLSTSVILGSLAISEWDAIDSCLDAGGSFNHDAGVCDMIGSHLQPSGRSASEMRLVLAAGSGVIGLVLLFRC